MVFILHENTINAVQINLSLTLLDHHRLRRCLQFLCCMQNIYWARYIVCTSHAILKSVRRNCTFYMRRNGWVKSRIKADTTTFITQPSKTKWFIFGSCWFSSFSYAHRRPVFFFISSFVKKNSRDKKELPAQMENVIATHTHVAVKAERVLNNRRFFSAVLLLLLASLSSFLSLFAISHLASTLPVLMCKLMNKLWVINASHYLQLGI